MAVFPLPVLLALALTTADAGAATRYEDGLAAFNRGDPVTAARVFEPLARAGDPDAEYWLGRIFADGRGRPADLVVAYGWFDRAAARGHQDAEGERAKLAKILTAAQIAEARRLTATTADPAPGKRPDLITPDLITGVQIELERLGYDPGPADGVSGARTRDAIERFQRDAAIEATGAASPDLLERLRGQAARAKKGGG
jgi:localization factor PodJL